MNGFKYLTTEEYNALSEEEQVHYDACVDYHSEEPPIQGICVCGTMNCNEEYAHTTSGY